MCWYLYYPKLLCLKERREMKLVLQNYAIIMHTEKTCVKLNNNTLNTPQRCDVTQNYRIIRRVV
jgi:hypothetical protein